MRLGVLGQLTVLLLAGCTSQTAVEPAAPAAATAANAAPASPNELAPSPASPGAEAPHASADSAGARDRAITLTHPRSSQPWLGVELEAVPTGEAGVKVVRTLPGSPAEKAGLLSGDVLLRIGERTVSRPAEVAAAVGTATLDSEVPVAFLRGGEPRLVRARLEGRPDFEDQLRLSFVGRRAPSIDGVVTFQGAESSLSELDGRVVLLEFWASWCGVCRFLAPVLDEWHHELSPAGLSVVGVTVDPPGLGADAGARAGMSYTLVSDGGGKITRAYLANQVPTVFVIDRSGVIVDVMVGLNKTRLGEVRTLVEELLREGS